MEMYVVGNGCLCDVKDRWLLLSLAVVYAIAFTEEIILSVVFNFDYSPFTSFDILMLASPPSILRATL